MLSVKNRLFLCAVFLLLGGAINAQEKLNILRINTVQELHEFFSYTGNDIPIISGHRGGMVKDFPENSIETFENTLKYVPAFYEIDPRLTKDSVIVLMHDATLDRTTTGSGKVADYTWEELRQLKLKDKFGNVTPYRIPTLDEAIIWAKGKTILNLDKKDVPPEMTVEKIKKHNAAAWVMVTVHTAEQAKFYTDKIENIMISALVKTEKQLKSYENAGIPFKQMIAYVGPLDLIENKKLYNLLHQKGVMCMISSAPTYDHFPGKVNRELAYRQVFKGGADILESDLPIEAGEAIKSLILKDSGKAKFFGP